jgi:type IV pilus assembly protein PilY1
MKKILFLSTLFIVSITSFGEDIELYISEAVKQSNQKPQVLIIFDNSGSMGTELYVNEDYDPDELYPAVGGYNSLSDKFVYFTKGGVDGVGLPVPDSPSESRRFLYDINNCATARYLLETQGFYTGHLREYSMKGNTGTWNEIPDNNGANVEVIDCEDDVNLVPETYTPAIDSSINLGINPDTGATFSEDGEDGYPVNGRGNKQNPIYFGTLAESESSVSWSGQLVTIYTDNYLRWHHGETIDQTLKSRMDIAKDSVSNVIKSAPSIDFGLQVFNYNSSSNNSGGRIIAGIKEMTAANQADLLNTIDDLSAETWTPLCETLYEASLYFAGKAIDLEMMTTVEILVEIPVLNKVLTIEHLSRVVTVKRTSF